MKYYVKQGLKCLTIMGIGFIIIGAIIFIKYRPVYKVSYLGEEIGYVKNKQQMEETIREFSNTTEGNVAFVDIKEMPEFQFEFVRDLEETVEEKLLKNVMENADITYRTYAIGLDGENKAYVNTIEEARSVVDELKEAYDNEINIEINEVYTENSFDVETVEAEIAKKEIESQIDLKDHGVNGILLSTPITGQITSRYGSRWGSTHTGLDIAGAVGTDIHACADGTVTFAGAKGTYGNLVIISHGNGVETYYAHCSKIYVKAGQEVKSGDVISARGSTGNSTGPHLHLEIRINGEPVNPQNYLYN